MLYITIITIDTIGLLNDAKLYKKYFKKYFKHYNKKYLIEIITNIKDINSRTNIILYLEQILNTEILDNINILKIFMPNHELFKNEMQFNLLKKINLILCKTHISYKFFKYIKKEHLLTFKIIYTNMTTIIPKNMKNINIQKDPNLFVLFAGTSRFKNVAVVINNWISNRCYINLDPDIKLIITCRNYCFSNAKKELKEYFNFDISKFKIQDNKIVYKNMTIYLDKIDEKTYYNLMRIANVAICISSKEGFGHYINEARYYNTFVITNNAEPMNNLINKNNGYLIDNLNKIDQNITFTKFKLYSVYPNNNEVSEAIIYCIKNKNSLNHDSYKYFKKDLKIFRNKIKNKVIPYLIKNIK